MGEKKELLKPIIKESEHTDVASGLQVLIKEMEGDNVENKLVHHHRGEPPSLWFPRRACGLRGGTFGQSAPAWVWSRWHPHEGHLGCQSRRNGSISQCYAKSKPMHTSQFSYCGSSLGCAVSEFKEKSSRAKTGWLSNQYGMKLLFTWRTIILASDRDADNFREARR